MTQNNGGGWRTLGKVRPQRTEQKEFERSLRRAQIDIDGLRRLRYMKAALEHIAVLIDEAVLLARSQDRSWEDIGDALGITKQSAHERFRDLE